MINKDMLYAISFVIGFYIISILLIDVAFEGSGIKDDIFILVSFLTGIGIYFGCLKVFEFISVFNRMTLEEMEDKE